MIIIVLKYYNLKNKEALDIITKYLAKLWTECLQDFHRICFKLLKKSK